MSDNIFTLFQSNRPIKLTEDTDYLNTIPKGEMIVDFLNNISTNEDAKIQMIALYGDWGSGKTSLMQWVQDHLDKDNFSTVFFEAWKYENDSNLALSLVDVISEIKDDKISGLVKEFGLALKSTLKGLIKGTTIDAKVVKFNLEKVVEESEKYLGEDDTFYTRINNFSTAYIKLENIILGKGTDKKLVAFLDDLDRCEPEKVLELLSMIKLFFTFGQRTIFIAGVDK